MADVSCVQLSRIAILDCNSMKAALLSTTLVIMPAYSNDVLAIADNVHYRRLVSHASTPTVFILSHHAPTAP